MESLGVRRPVVGSIAWLGVDVAKRENIELKAEDRLNPACRSRIRLGVWPVNRLEATARLLNDAIKVCGCPVDGANNLVGVVHDSADDANVHDAKATLSLAHHALDGDAISARDLCGSLGLMALLPAEHPKAVLHEALVLVLDAAPRCSD